MADMETELQNYKKLRG